MLSIVNKDNALSIVSRYYTKAAITGYIAHSSVQRMLAYFFLIDFVETLYPYFVDYNDYQNVNMAFVKIFSDGGCLFPYEAMNPDSLIIGKSHYMGGNALRITIDNIMRETENDFLRRVI